VIGRTEQYDMAVTDELDGGRYSKLPNAIHVKFGPAIISATIGTSPEGPSQM
jgi:hypothetical protein